MTSDEARKCPKCGCGVISDANMFLHDLLHDGGSAWAEFGDSFKLNSLPFILFPIVAKAMDAWAERQLAALRAQLAEREAEPAWPAGAGLASALADVRSELSAERQRREQAEAEVERLKQEQCQHDWSADGGEQCIKCLKIRDDGWSLGHKRYMEEIDRITALKESSQEEVGQQRLIIADAIRERDEARQEVERLKALNNEIVCAFCGWKETKDGDPCLKMATHITECDKHPMRALAIAWQQATRELDEANAGAAAMREALAWTLPFREFSDSWHDQNNKDVVRFRELRAAALATNAGAALLAERDKLREAIELALAKVVCRDAGGDSNNTFAWMPTKDWDQFESMAHAALGNDGANKPTEPARPAEGGA